ncbi:MULTISPECIES: DUF2283 domain-containing protein [unclassified Cyanobium]|uniref:DUF2283 domain-containing protein n=1 Tax=unclassified Cyanobium TaxID=2627006 RepID=UPI0028F41FDC|nr:MULTISPECIES: DUF2283 domain-containing protein [unclassified Cyanobium]
MAPPCAMKIRYFPDTDTLYIELADRVSSSSEALSDNLIVDFDELGKPVGVTLLPISPVLQPAQKPCARNRSGLIQRLAQRCIVDPGKRRTGLH